MTIDQFTALQQILIDAFMPWIQLWIMFYIVGAVAAGIFIVFLSVAGALIAQET